jgi:hypothetical protein
VVCPGYLSCGKIASNRQQQQAAGSSRQQKTRHKANEYLLSTKQPRVACCSTISERKTREIMQWREYEEKIIREIFSPHVLSLFFGGLVCCAAVPKREMNRPPEFVGLL